MRPESTPDGIGNQDRIIGVVGVAPWSTLQFCEILYKEIPAMKDWHYPQVIFDVNTKIPSRGRHFDLGEEDFSPYIHDSILKLKKMGAAVVVVTCNTAHIHYERWAENTGVQVPHIGIECVHQIKKESGIKTVVLGGWSLWKSGLYKKLLQDVGIGHVNLIDDDARLVSKVIEEIKKLGSVNNASLAELEIMFDKLRKQGADSIILGCTELSLLNSLAENFFPIVVDSNISLARAALKISMSTSNAM